MRSLDGLQVVKEAQVVPSAELSGKVVYGWETLDDMARSFFHEGIRSDLIVVTFEDWTEEVYILHREN